MVVIRPIAQDMVLRPMVKDMVILVTIDVPNRHANAKLFGV